MGVAIKKRTGQENTASAKLEEKLEDVVQVVSIDNESQADSLLSNPFKDPAVAQYYHDLYEKSQYECRSAFDPDFEWSPEEEKKVIRKLDSEWRSVLAVVDDLLPDLGMNTNDYNTGNTIFLVAFLLAELPSQVISKKLGPDIFILCRCVPGVASSFVVVSDFPFALSDFTSLLAFGILRMRGIAGLAGWRWLFIIEGLFTLIIGLLAFYLMVPSAVQTKNWLHPKGWFTDRQEKIVVNRTRFDLKMIAKSAWDYDLWPVFAIGFIAYIPNSTIQPYMTLSMRSLGFSRFDTNLLTIPSAVLHIITLLLITWFSERINERALTCLAYPIMVVPFLAAIRWWPGSGENAWVTWFLVTMVCSVHTFAICVSWVSRNSNSIRSRSVCSALYNMTVQIGAIGAANIYREDDKPRYRRGNMQLFIIAVALIPLLLLVKFYYVFRTSRDKIWNAMTAEEQEEYIKTTTDEGNKRLDFRFDH
ncbi:hypothetical protein CA3LBN_004225 [Candidozyma haemuli]|uniref:Allantoate permease n=1 Tax=Candidozyma haemuli TaxID=45357 RepID=A0ABX8ICV6_9ASCO|nr:hypothetical protein CA3LBN_004225 [[Candida] haemuloni]